MLKLLKYDFRRSRDFIWMVFALLLVVQAGIWISNEGSQMELLSFSAIVYILAGIFLLFHVCRTYRYNLKSYHRRLLPVSSLGKVVSPLLFYLLLLLAVSVVALIHLLLYRLVTPSYPDVDLSGMFGVILALLWGGGFLMILIMLTITMAQSVRFKGALWAALGFFIVLQNLIAWSEQKLFGSEVGLLEVFRVNITAASSASSGSLKVEGGIPGISIMIYEAVIAAVALAVTAYLARNKVES